LEGHIFIFNNITKVKFVYLYNMHTLSNCAKRYPVNFNLLENVAVINPLIVLNIKSGKKVFLYLNIIAGKEKI